MYDFIVIGAGSAGCVLANRLSANGAKVLLLEAGGPDTNPLIRAPGLYGALQDTDIDWGYRTVPQAHLLRRRIFCSRGRVIGGSSSINFMVYMRGNRSDFDHWAQLGNRGWSYDDILPFFTRSEDHARLGPPFHGKGGPMHVREMGARQPLTSIFVEAAKESGLPFNDDVNGAAQDGVSFLQSTINEKGRISSATAFLDPARDRANLTIVTHALVTRIVIANGRATGVDYFSPQDGLTRAQGGEIILSAGAFNSPQILMLSGVGPADQLRSIGVAPIHDLPGVGENLQDHLRVRVRYEIAEPLTMFGLSAADASAARKEFYTSGTGLFASNFIEVGAFITCDPASASPDIQMFLAPSFGASTADGGAIDRHGFSLAAYVCRPRSRGDVKIASANPLDRPIIDPNYFSAPEDVALSIAAVARMRVIGATTPFQRIGATEIFPGADITGGDAMDTYVRRDADTSWHPVGTCKMGIDEKAVVDPELRVHGLKGLRVVDASIMPTLVSANTNAAVIMIAEKAAEMILQ